MLSVPVLIGLGLVTMLLLSEGVSRSFARGAFLLVCALMPLLLGWRFGGWWRPIATGQSVAGRTWGGRWKRWLAVVLIAFAIAMPLKLWVLEAFVIPVKSMEPELPAGSLVLVWKLTRHFVPGDIIAHKHGDRVWVSRVVSEEKYHLFLHRNQWPEEKLLRADVIGKVVSVLWRATPGDRSTLFGPATAAVPQHIDFKVLRVENPPGTRDILLHFERDTNAALGLEVWQGVTPSPGLRKQPQPGTYLDSQMKTWAGVNHARVLRWTLPNEFTAAEVRAVVKDIEQRAKFWRALDKGQVMGFATVTHQRWLEVSSRGHCEAHAGFGRSGRGDTKEAVTFALQNVRPPWHGSSGS